MRDNGLVAASGLARHNGLAAAGPRQRNGLRAEDPRQHSGRPAAAGAAMRSMLDPVEQRRCTRRVVARAWAAASAVVAAAAAGVVVVRWRPASDIRFKHDIVLLGHLSNGLGYYRFSYNGSDRAYVGVMAQEVETVMPEAVVHDRDGSLRVLYDRLGIKFQTYDEWIARAPGYRPGPCVTLTWSRERTCDEDAMNRALVPVLDRSASLQCFGAMPAAFKTPDEAAGALAGAAKASDMKALVTVLGPDGEDIVSSGDEVADARRARSSSPRTTQSIGSPWRVTTRRSWSSDRTIFRCRFRSCARMACGASTRPRAVRKFSSAALARTSLTLFRHVLPMSMRKTNTPRRIGPARLNAYANASSASLERRTGFIGRPQGEEASPLGEFIAQATRQGYRVGGGRTPYHGYYYKILTRQGSAADGGEFDYVFRQDGRRICSCRVSGRISEFGCHDISSSITPASYFRRILGRVRPSWRSE